MLHILYKDAYEYKSFKLIDKHYKKEISNFGKGTVIIFWGEIKTLCALRTSHFDIKHIEVTRINTATLSLVFHRLTTSLFNNSGILFKMVAGLLPCAKDAQKTDVWDIYDRWRSEGRNIEDGLTHEFSTGLVYIIMLAVCL